MHEDTKFLLGRMDSFEARVMEKLDRLEAFKNKFLGMAILLGGVSGLVVELIARHMS